MVIYLVPNQKENSKQNLIPFDLSRSRIVHTQRKRVLNLVKLYLDCNHRARIFCRGTLRCQKNVSFG